MKMELVFRLLYNNFKTDKISLQTFRCIRSLITHIFLIFTLLKSEKNVLLYTIFSKTVS